MPSPTRNRNDASAVLGLLAQLEHEDLYEWCTLLLSDESVEVRTAALQTIVHCNDGDTELLLPFVESQNKRIRAAAIAALAKHCPPKTRPAGLSED